MSRALRTLNYQLVIQIYLVMSFLTESDMQYELCRQLVHTALQRKHEGTKGQGKLSTFKAERKRCLGRPRHPTQTVNVLSAYNAATMAL